MASETIRLSDPAELYISAYDIRESNRRLASKLTERYAKTGKLIMVNLRKGAGAFVWETMGMMKIDDIIYTEMKTRTMDGMVGGSVEITEGPDVSLAGEHVLIADDVFDRGHTMQKVVDYCEDAGAASVEATAMFEKVGVEDQISLSVPLHVGMQIANRFIVGKGLDYNNQYRHYPHVSVCAQPQDAEPYPLVRVDPDYLTV